MAVTGNDVPVVDSVSADYWRAGERGALIVRRCNSCERVHHYPRRYCPLCWSDDVGWIETSGRGTVYSYSVIRVSDMKPFSERLPYVVAVVELDEGPRIGANLEGVDVDAVRIGMPVAAVFRKQSDDVWVPYFVPGDTTGTRS